MKINKYILLLILIVLGGLTWYLTNNKSTNQDNSYDFSYREFPIENTDDIGKIMLYQRNGTTVKLERDGDKWKVNDKYIADRLMINNLLSVIKNIRIDYVPPDAAVKNIITK
ncbi:MAG: hypothetical protein R2771_04545 [Saprospiraceae bacterium]